MLDRLNDAIIESMDLIERRIEVEVANERHRLRYREGYPAPSGGED